MHGETGEQAARGSGEAGGAGASSGKRGKHAVSDRDEKDEALAEEAAASMASAGIKLTRQPSTVTGIMRDYQLEGEEERLVLVGVML